MVETLLLISIELSNVFQTNPCLDVLLPSVLPLGGLGNKHPEVCQCNDCKDQHDQLYQKPRSVDELIPCCKSDNAYSLSTEHIEDDLGMLWDNVHFKGVRETYNYSTGGCQPQEEKAEVGLCDWWCYHEEQLNENRYSECWNKYYFTTEFVR